jgi:molybdate transport system regulatory protein
MKEALSVRSKIWIEDGTGNVVFGLGRLRMLEAVKAHGSLHAAARELGMGYRALWARLHATEERLNAPLLVKRQGGSAGGGSALTPLAERLVEEFRRIHREVERTTDMLFAGALGSELDPEASFCKPASDNGTAG